MVATGGEAPQGLEEITIHSTELVDRPLAGLPFAAPVEIIVEAAAWAQMTHHACEDLIHEVGGIMLGEVYEHEGRGAVRVTAAVPARGAINTLASIQFTHDAWRQMEKLRRDSARGEKMVGWYHTHPGLSVFFSSTDTFMHESFFTQPWHVALVLDPVQGDHRFYRWEAGKIRASTDFLLQCADWQGPQPPLHLVLGGALRRAADALELAPEDRGAVLGAGLRRLGGSLRRAPEQRPGDDLLPLLVACAELPSEVLAAARQRLDEELAADRPIDLAELLPASRNHNPRGALAIGAGWLAQLVDPRRVHLHRLEAGQPACRILALPTAVHDVACDERGELLLLTRDPQRPLRRLQPSLSALVPSSPGADAPPPKLALANVEIDWAGHEPAGKLGSIRRGRRLLYLLTRDEIYVLSAADPARPWTLRVEGAHPASCCGWGSFAKLRDWSVDGADNLFLLGASREVWCFEPLLRSWRPFPTGELDSPELLCAGQTTLWAYDSARRVIARYGIPDGRLLGCRPVGEELLRQRIWRLASDGYRRLYIATGEEILCSR